jgi:single-strand DNA-binding protein
MSKGTVNKAIIIGRLGKDPDMRYTPSGLAVANFNVATNFAVKDSSGNFTDKTEWHRIVAYGKQAEFAGENLHKGRLVFIEGRIQSRQWEDKEGQKRYTTEIICSTLQPLGPRGEGEGAKTEAETPEVTEAAETGEAGVDNNQSPAKTSGEEDDLPF